jgi:hypothetical protein
VDNGFKCLWKQSQALGLAPSFLCLIAWVAGGATVAREVGGELWRYPRLAEVTIWVIATVVSIGGLVGVWIVADLIRYWRLGYRIRWRSGNDWVYEERRAQGSVQCLPFSRVTLADGYPAPCEVHIPSEACWERETPEWAQQRRAEILKRIAQLSGADAGGHVEFKDSA